MANRKEDRVLSNWFWRILGLRPAKDTEARRLKEAIRDGVAECKEKAAKGDSDASLRLNALKENVTEQSIRLKGKALAVLMVAVLALAVAGGCSGLGAKTAKDIETASSMILPEYLAYVDADPKLKPEQKQDRRDQVRALKDVIRAAQK
jgi:hypothetical protein